MSDTGKASRAGRPAAGGTATDRQAALNAAFVQLVEQHQTHLYRFILRRIGHPDDAAELAQQVLLEAYRNLERFRGDSAMSTWLYGIAQNFTRNYRSRVAPKRNLTDSDDALQTLAADGLDPEEALLRKERMRRVSQAVDTLAEEYREAFILVILEERSYEETAELLGVPVGTIRSRISRARGILRQSVGSA